MVSLALPQSALQNWLQPERSGQLARLVNVLLVIWLAWLLANLSWLFIPEPEVELLPEPVVAVAPAQHKRSRIDERQIASWHLFGVAGEEKPVKAAPAAIAPETRLKLTLRGLFASDDSAGGHAIIGDPKGKEESYAVGDPVPGGAKISEIYPDRVILERNGRYETLRLPKDRTSSNQRNTRQKTVTSGLRRSTKGQAAAFTKYRNEVKQNPAAFMNYVRATPARKDGKFIGFRLQAGKQRGAMKELGLEPGDIVTSINNVEIDSPAKGMKAMQALGEGESVNVTLLRGGQEVSMSLTLPSATK
jgi:general secretion pathway protein C